MIVGSKPGSTRASSCRTWMQPDDTHGFTHWRTPLLARRAMRLSALSVLLTASLTGIASTEGKFTDPEDGKYNMSDMLLSHRGVLPVPTIVTEPAVGYRLGLGLLYFSMPKHDPDAPQSDA